MRKLLILPVVALVLAGCSTFRTTPEYTQAESVPPLTVPEGLNAPDTSQAYQVPPGPRGVLSEEDVRPPRVLASTRASAEGFVSQVLQVHDQPDSVWRRLGFALPRIGVKVLSKDAQKRRYQVAETVRVPIQRGWFSRIFLFWKPKYRDVDAIYLLEVRPQEDISRIFIGLGNAEASEERAKALLKLLKLRLG